MTGERIDAAEFTRRIHELVPVSKLFGIEAVSISEDGSAEVHIAKSEGLERPGGSISGPALMALADVAMFGGVNGRLGWTPMAMTATLNTTFLRPPKPETLVAHARPLRFGRRLAFYEVAISTFSAPDEVVAHVTGSYALPDAR